MKNDKPKRKKHASQELLSWPSLHIPSRNRIKEEDSNHLTPRKDGRCLFSCEKQ
jgi:hypothetical protein